MAARGRPSSAMKRQERRGVRLMYGVGKSGHGKLTVGVKSAGGAGAIMKAHRDTRGRGRDGEVGVLLAE